MALHLFSLAWTPLQTCSRYDLRQNSSIVIVIECSSRVVLSDAVVQDLQLAMSPTTQDLLDKDAIAMFVASRARRCGGVYAAVRDKALEILEMLPAESLMPEHEHPAVAAIISSRATASTAG